MTTNENGGTAATTTEPPKIVAAGGPIPVTMPLPPQSNDDNSQGGAAGGAATKTPEEIAAEAAAAESAKNKLPELSDDQLKELLKGKGIEFEGDFTGLKEKLKPAAAEPTAEEKAAAEAAMDKRMLETFMKGGGTPEVYVQLKQIASADLTELSKSEISREMKAAGFSDDDIKIIMAERYYQINVAELQKDENETDEDFAKRKELVEKKVKYGTGKLSNKALHIKTQADKILGGLRTEIQTEEMLAKEEAKFSSKVDEFAAKLPRKVAFELGKVNDQQIPPVEFEVTQGDIDTVVSTLKDPAKRQQFFFNEDNSLNLTNVAEVMLRNQYLEKALKATYLEGGTRQVEIFEKTFGGKLPSDLGVGGKSGGNNGRKGVVTSAGAPQPVSPATK
jgi:hypothetical protein